MKLYMRHWGRLTAQIFLFSALPSVLILKTAISYELNASTYLGWFGVTALYFCCLVVLVIKKREEIKDWVELARS